MGMHSLGIDISDSRITGVVLEQHRKMLKVRACLSLPLADGGDLAESIHLLYRQLEWQEGYCVCGLPLSLFSVRNLILPFTDQKKIAQVLPFELEEQVLSPIDSLITRYSVCTKDSASKSILTFSLDRTLLGDLLAGIRSAVDPDVVTPAMVPLVAQIARAGKNQPNFVLVHADLHSSTMALVLNGQAMFYRRLVYPEQMVLHPPFQWREDEVVVTDPVAAGECFHLFSSLIMRSLDYYRMDSGVEGKPERVVLVGPLAGMSLLSETVTAASGLPVEVVDLPTAVNVVLPPPEEVLWREHHFDRALALAMQGYKRAEVNFRTGELAKKRPLFRSRKHLRVAMGAAAFLGICFFVFLWYDFHRLNQRDKALGEEMAAIFAATFPEATKVRDPYIEMQARLKSAQGPAAPALSLYQDKRTLGLLADISARIPASVALRVNRLAIDREAVVIKGVTDTFNSVQIIKNSLAASARYKSVQIISATADKEQRSGAIRFEVQLQLEGL